MGEVEYGDYWHVPSGNLNVVHKQGENFYRVKLEWASGFVPSDEYVIKFYPIFLISFERSTTSSVGFLVEIFAMSPVFPSQISI